MLIFKYLSADALQHVLTDPNLFQLKFGHPRDYNDPYELFLQADEALDEEQTAFFKHLVGELVQLPTSCFSHVPDSMPMWAHYGMEHAGVCIAFDEDSLANQFPVAYLEDVEYSDEPAVVSAGGLNFAWHTGKGRHAQAIISRAYRAAYYTKRSEWKYEQERRLVVRPDSVSETDAGLLIGSIETSCAQAVIVGQNSSPETIELCEERASSVDIPLYRLKQGHRTYQPFFLELRTNRVFRWAGGQFVEADETCPVCGEPSAVDSDADACVWCSVSDEAIQSAGRRSMLSIAVNLGIDHPYGISFAGIEPRGREVPSPPATSNTARGPE